MIHFTVEDDFYIRFVCFSSARLVGSYRFDDKLQLSEVPADSPRLDVEMGQHPLLVELELPKPDLEAIRAVLENGLHERSDRYPNRALLNEYARTKQTEICAILVLVVDPYIRLPRLDHVWTVRIQAEAAKTEYLQRGYVCDLRGLGEKGFREVDEQKIPKTSDNAHFNRFGQMVGDKLMLPNSADEIFENYFSLGDERKATFQRSVGLFQQAIRTKQISASLMYVGMVSAIENLIAYEGRGDQIESCNECGQPRYKVRQKFLSFMTKYTLSAPEFRAVADEMYRIRSGIGHAGALLSGDLVGQFVSAEDGLESFSHSIKVEIATRIALLNWLKFN